MSIDLVLATFRDKPGLRVGRKKLSQIKEAVQRVMGLPKNSVGETLISLEKETLHVDLSGGTAEVHSDHAVFPIAELDARTLGVIFEVATVGDMILLTEGGSYSAIVMNASQRSRIPEEEWRTPKAAPICRSVKHLGTLLAGWHREHREFIDKAATARAQGTASGSPPSSTPVAAGYYLDKRSNKWIACSNVLEVHDTEYVRFYRFDPQGNEIPKHPKVLEEFKAICENQLRLENRKKCKLKNDDDWPPLLLVTPNHSVDIWPARAMFTFYDLTPTVIQLMYEIALAGDFSLVAPGGVILTDPAQEARVPEAWKRNKPIALSRSPDELLQFLKAFQIDIPPKKRNYLFDARGYIPGSVVNRERVIYLEALPDGTARKHQKMVYDYWDSCAGDPQRPKGAMMSRFWELTTPEGCHFYAYDYNGEGFLDFFGHLAKEKNIKTGTIVNFETFVQDDGKRFPISSCEISKVDLSKKS